MPQHVSHTGSGLTWAAATVFMAEPVERVLHVLAGANAEDIKWAISMLGGLVFAIIGLYCHVAERAERARIRREKLDDDARREKIAADNESRRQQEMLDVQQRLKLAELQRDLAATSKQIEHN